LTLGELRESRETLGNLSFAEWCRYFVKITDKRGRLIPFVLNTMQRKVDALGAKRLILLGPRQNGKTLHFLAAAHQEIVLAELFGDRSLNIMVLLHDEKATLTALGRFALMMKLTPEWLRPEMKHDSIFEKTFARTESRVFIQTAGQVAPGQSYTNHRVLCSEAAHPKFTDELMAGVSESVPPPEFGGVLIVESVSYGPEGQFYERYVSVRDDGIWKKMFVPWWWADDYRRGDPQARLGTLWGSEKALMEEEGLRADQIRWRRDKIYELCPGDCQEGGVGEAIFQTQYPEDEVTAFLGSSGKPFIAPRTLKRHLSAITGTAKTCELKEENSRWTMEAAA